MENNQIQNEKLHLIATLIEKALKVVDQPREQEIITRRFGLNGAKETWSKSASGSTLLANAFDSSKKLHL